VSLISVFRFQETAVILFLNKKDLFQDKLQVVERRKASKIYTYIFINILIEREERREKSERERERGKQKNNERVVPQGAPEPIYSCVHRQDLRRSH